MLVMARVIRPALTTKVSAPVGTVAENSRLSIANPTRAPSRFNQASLCPLVPLFSCHSFQVLSGKC